MIKIYLEYNGEYLTFYYDSAYCSGSIPINSIADLIYAIEQICGKGSSLVHNKDGKVIVPYIQGPLTHFQQSVKTGVIEQCRSEAILAWGQIPELQIGWLEKQMYTYEN